MGELNAKTKDRTTSNQNMTYFDVYLRKQAFSGEANNSRPHLVAKVICYIFELVLIL